MPVEIALTFFGFSVILVFVVLVLGLMVLSARQELLDGRPIPYLLPLAAVILALCAFVTIASFATKARRASEFYRIGQGGGILVPALLGLLTWGLLIYLGMALWNIFLSTDSAPLRF